MPDIVVTDCHLGIGKNGVDVIDDGRKHTGHEMFAFLVSGDTGLDAVMLKERNIHLALKPTSGNELIGVLARLLSP